MGELVYIEYMGRLTPTLESDRSVGGRIHSQGASVWLCALVVAGLLLLSAPFASALTPPRVAFSAQIPGLDSAQFLDVLQSSAGEVTGYLHSDPTAKKIVILDAAGNVQREVQLDYAPGEIIHRYSADGDTLAIYTITPPIDSSQTDAAYPYFVRKLVLLSVTADTVTIKVVSRRYSWYFIFRCESGFDLGNALHFRTHPDGSKTVVSGFSLRFDCWYPTVGAYWDTWVGTTEYGLDLSGPLTQWPASDIVDGHFSDNPSTTISGYRRISTGNLWMTGGPWPEYDSTGTYLWAPGWTDPAGSWSWSIHAYPFGVWGGHFNPADPFDEVIIQSTNQDWVGRHPFVGAFTAAYSFSSGSVTEKWYTLGGTASPSVYYPAENCLVGASCNTVTVLRCDNGHITTPLPLDHCLATPKMILPQSPSGKLRLVGRAADTLFLYEFDQLVDVPQPGQPLPESFELSQNYPNPFNPSTTISYNLPRRADVTIEIFNLLGQRVRTLVNESQPPGSHTVEWDGRDTAGKTASSGVYLYRLTAGDFMQSRKMILLK